MNRKLGGYEPCGDCGEPLHEHLKKKVFHENGRWSFDLYCPEGA